MKLIDKDALVMQANIEITNCRLAAQEGILTEFGKGKLEGLEGIIDFLNTLEVKEVQEEPVSDTQSPVIFYGLTGSVGSPKEEPVSEQNLSNVQRTVKNWKEPVNEELGDYINKLSKQFPEVSFAKLSRIAVRVAKWQKQQDKETIEVAEDHAYFAGMEKMKEQMLAKAIDARCFGFQGAALFSFRLPADNYLVGSEVKVIVIEED